uniref:hypothetical protein n=1 Tax=Vibrio cholerae TaxID=666 RepID=UPI001CA32AF6
ADSTSNDAISLFLVNRFKPELTLTNTLLILGRHLHAKPHNCCQKAICGLYKEVAIIVDPDHNIPLSTTLS